MTGTPGSGTKPRVGLACSEDVRRVYVDAADLARLEAFADFSYRGFSVASGLGGPPPPDARAEAELAGFASGLDVLLVCHGAPFVSAAVLEAAPRLSLLGELEGDRFAYRLDLEAASRAACASSTRATARRGRRPSGRSASRSSACATPGRVFAHDRPRERLRAGLRALRARASTRRS